MRNEQEDYNDLFIRYGLRPLARAGKSVAKGVAGIGDFVNLPVNAARSGLGYQPLQNPSDIVENAFNQYTGGLTSPQNNLERYVDTAGEFATGGIPFTKAGNLSQLAPTSLMDLLRGGGAGFGAEAANEVAPGNPFATLGGAILGGLTPDVAKLGGQLGLGTAKLVPNFFPNINAQKQLQSINPESVTESVAASKRLNEHLTPAEASGNAFAAAKQGTLGTSEKGALKLHEFGENQRNRRENNISGLLENISPENKQAISVDQQVQDAASNIIKKRENTLKEKAAPIYDDAYKIDLPKDTLKELQKNYPVLTDALKYVKNNSAYKSELKNVSPQSTKVWDLVKRRLDDQYRNLQGNQSARYEASLLLKAKNKLVDEIDALNPKYKQARAIYADDAPNIQALREGNIGKIANLDVKNIKNIGKTIFDRQQTNPEVFRELQKEIFGENPAAWNGIVRQEIERRIESPQKGASNFYNKILKDKNSYQQFHEALASNPVAQRTLADMKLSWKNLIEPVIPKTAARLAKSSLGQPRSSSKDIKNDIMNYVFGGNHDEAAVDLILNPKWHNQLKAIQTEVKNPNQRFNYYLPLMESIRESGLPQNQDNPLYKLSDEELDNELRRLELESLSDEELERLLQ